MKMAKNEILSFINPKILALKQLNAEGYYVIPTKIWLIALKKKKYRFIIVRKGKPIIDKEYRDALLEINKFISTFGKRLPQWFSCEIWVWYKDNFKVFTFKKLINRIGLK